MTKKIKITGDIVDDDTALMYDFFGMSCTSPKAVDAVLDDTDIDTDISDPDVDPNDVEDVVIDIASNGGDVYAGSEIYTALRAYKGRVIVNVLGLAASAASVIAMAGDTVNISPTAQMMIHKAWSVQQGNSDDYKHEAEILDGIDQSIVNAYVDKTGLDRNKILQMMQNETWMTAQDAVSKGFADGIMFHNDDDDNVDDPDSDDGSFDDALQVAASAHSIPTKASVKKFMMMLKQRNLNTPSLTKSKQKTKKVMKTSLYQQKLDLLLQEKEG
ncbi:head maturation protease, ClpP-related [Limosilactobacillus reuteri]|uniref:head maturation protease, ClpP-related n=1 Tax=Limosilactobacillus reuteri TaxID=1598 RepID=UPI001E4153BF|nr:head maturation protease, ClpP-related [Limosilactobacillus reuteri]MCC4501838.1 Clp protease ClpP [Limosilactobacillus reuteri]